MLIAPLAFAGESTIYLQGWEFLSPLERAARLAMIGSALAVAAMMVGRATTARRRCPDRPRT